MKNTVIAVLAVLVVAFVWYGFAQKGEVAALRDELASATSEEGLIGASSRLPAEVKELKEQVEALKVKLEKATVSNGAAVKGGDSPAKKRGKKADASEAMESIVKMMSDPAMKDVMRQQQRVAVNGLYGEFFRELGLPEDQERAILELILDRQMAVTTSGMKMLDKTMPNSERKEISEGLKDEMNRIKDEIKTMLGDEAFESFELFEGSQQERQQISTYKEALKAKGLTLNFETEEALMTAMYETRKDFKFTNDFGTDTVPNPEAWQNFNKESVDTLMVESRELHDQIFEKAKPILTPEQLEAFMESLASYQKMQEMGLEMSLGFVKEAGE